MSQAIHRLFVKKIVGEIEFESASETFYPVFKLCAVECCYLTGLFLNIFSRDHHKLLNARVNKLLITTVLKSAVKGSYFVSKILKTSKALISFQYVEKYFLLFFA